MNGDTFFLTSLAFGWIKSKETGAKNLSTPPKQKENEKKNRMEDMIRINYLFNWLTRESMSSEVWMDLEFTS